MPLDEPSRVVELPERDQRVAELLDGVEGPHPQQVLLQGADEALGAAIAFRGSDEGGRAVDTEKGQFLLEVIGHVLRAMVVTHRQAAGTVPGHPAEMAAHALADRLQRLARAAA